MKSTTEDFIKKAKEIHGNDYDYSRVKYVNNKTKVLIMCPEHGEFNKTPIHHLNRKQGCGKCSNEKFGLSQLKTTKQFIKGAKEIHGDIYDYSRVEYIGNKSKIKIICSEHGEFEQIPDNHLSGKGCKYCGGTAKMDTKLFIKKAKEIHGDIYDYSRVKYIDNKSKVIIICSEHGEFQQTPNNHTSKQEGCVKCLNRINDSNTFIKKAKEIHADKYDYSKVNFINMNENIIIKCSIHGDTIQTPLYHIYNYGCKKCGNSISILENELSEFMVTLGIKFEKNDRTILNGKELDIYIPSKKIAIEFNGLYWHSEKYIPKDYHLNKTLECEKLGIRLIHIFEDEWLYKKEIVKSRLKNLLGLTEIKIYGRKCQIKILDNKITNNFLNKNHIQDKCVSKIKLGLYYEGELVSLMTFGKRKILNNSDWELIRFCNKLDTTVIGGASKLLKYFINNYKPDKIISFADRRWSSGNLYNNLNFNLIKCSPPNYYLYNDNLKIRESRIKYQKHKLVKMGYNKNLTEKEITEKMKLYRIYDCGNLKYLLTI